jgi:Raf kinase inhibitor-like YbhB/YbcL family protein
VKKPPLLLVYGLSILVFVLLSCLALYLLGPVEGDTFSTIIEETESTANPGVSMELTSTAFSYNEEIPVKYSCNGGNVSPQLSWNEPPAGTQSFVILMDDPDAPSGTYDHWVLFNIPPETRTLLENFQPAAPIIVGKNSSGQRKYIGPCPPSGTHRYFFKLYALDTTLSLSASAYKNDVLTAMEGHILAQGELMGTFSK